MNLIILPEIFRRFSMDSEHKVLIVKILIVSLIAKAGFFAGGLAIDDYGFLFGSGGRHWDLFISQGRFIPAVVILIIDSFGVVIPDQQVVFGLVAIFLQAIFFSSVLRFCRVDKLPDAAVIGALIMAHPYGAEIFTFKQSLPFYSIALIFSIFTLELVIYNCRNKFVLMLAFFSCLLMLFTYQIFINFFAALIPLAWIAGRLAPPDSEGGLLESGEKHVDRSVTLAIVTLAALVVYIFSLACAKYLGFLHNPTERAQLLPIGMIFERVQQVWGALINIYWADEPILPAWLKLIILAMLMLSMLRIIRHVIAGQFIDRTVLVFFVCIGLLLMIPLSLGVIVPFQGWWPVPRVISHVPVIIGLIFIIGDYCGGASSGVILRGIQTGLRVIIIFGFVLMDNQIFADQRKINQWDKFFAQQILVRIEESPHFDEVKYLYIDGGGWGYQAGIRTVQGDMNISAFGAAWSKVNLVNYATGNRFAEAVGERRTQAEVYCASAQPWPARNSTKVIGDLAIVCRAK